MTPEILATLLKVGKLPSTRYPAATSSPHGRLSLIDDATLALRQPPQALVEGMIPEGGLAVLYGEPGLGKSFLALDLAYSIATGLPWMDRSIIPGPVIYIAGEGIGGLPKRVAAWKDAHGADGPVDVHFISDAVLFTNDEDISELTSLLATLVPAPQLIIVDTLARAMAGSDDGSGRDMGGVIQVVDKMRHAFGCAILLVHHSLKSEGRIERGSSQLRGAADAMVAVVRGSHFLKLRSEKTKDYEPFTDVQFSLENHLDSCVPVYRRSLTGRDSTDREDLTASQTAMLRVLASLPEIVNHSTWWEAAQKVGISHGTFSNGLNKLKGLGYVVKESQGRYALYSLTTFGQAVLVHRSTGPTE